MDTLFKTSNNYSSLSLKDVMEARDHFHYHLMNKKNVVATADIFVEIRSILMSARMSIDDLAMEVVTLTSLDHGSRSGSRRSIVRQSGDCVQAILLAAPYQVVASAPVEGFLHKTNVLDTLGDDETDTPCRLNK